MATLKYRDPSTGQWVPIVNGGETIFDPLYVNITGDTTTGPISVPTPTAAGHAATKGYADAVVPVGAIPPHAGSAAPSGWLFCQGQAVSRTTYAALFAVCSTTYGTGDGSTTFALPDLRGRSPVGLDSGQTEFDGRGEKGGASTVTLGAAHVPNATGQIKMHGVAGANGYRTTISGTGGVWKGSQGATDTYHSHQDPVSGAPSTGVANFSLGFSGGSHPNMQPYRVMHYIIKAV